MLLFCSVVLSRVWLWEPRGCSPPGSSVPGISQPRILEWVALLFPRGSSRPRDQTHVYLYLLHWQADSWPLMPPRKPCCVYNSTVLADLPSGIFAFNFSAVLNFCLHQQFPTVLVPGTSCMEDNLSMDQGGGPMVSGWFSSAACSLGPWDAQFTVGFTLLWASNAAHLSGGGAQAVKPVMGRGCKYR